MRRPESLEARERAPSESAEVLAKDTAKIESVTALDKHTVRFALERPYAPFLSIIPVATVVNWRVIEPHVVGNDWGNAWLSSNGAGSGAYIPDPASYIPAKALDLKRNPKHFMGWSHNAKPIDLIRVRPVAETTTRVLALMKGEIDAGDSYLPTDQVERLSKVKDVVVPPGDGGRDRGGGACVRRGPSARRGFVQ